MSVVATLVALIGVVALILLAAKDLRKK